MIQDNSFLIEEAYNQERQVVQHMFTFMRDWESHDWSGSFTQEWPAFGPLDQLSFSTSLAGIPGAHPVLQMGQTFLNYRYQLVSNDRLAVSPRLSAVIPGRSDPGLSTGFGLQTSLPASIMLGGPFVSHWNLGAS
jgi:hypothetical protein